MISHAILSGASETKSDSLLAINFGGTESAMVLVGALLLRGIILWRCCKCCCYRCCRSRQLTSKQAQHQAIANLASLAMSPSPQIQESKVVEPKDLEDSKKSKVTRVKGSGTPKETKLTIENNKQREKLLKLPINKQEGKFQETSGNKQKEKLL